MTVLDPKLQRRMERVRVLLRTRNDYLPGPSAIATGALSGPAPSDNVVCPDCRGSGSRPLGRGLWGGRICGSCDGDGMRRRVGREPAYDEYTQSTVGDENTGQRSTRAMTPRELDASIANLERMEAEREGRYDHETFGWERAHKARDRSGSYLELERWMDVMPANERHILTIVYEVDIPGAATVAPATERAAVQWLAEHMRGVIRIPDWAYNEETERLRAEVKALLVNHDAREVAEILALSLHRVKTLSAK